MLDVLLVVVYFKKLKRKTSQKDNKLVDPFAFIHFTCEPHMFHGKESLQFNPQCPLQVPSPHLTLTLDSQHALKVPHQVPLPSALHSPSSAPSAHLYHKINIQNSRCSQSVYSIPLALDQETLASSMGGFFGSVAANLDKTCLAKTQKKILYIVILRGPQNKTLHKTMQKVLFQQRYGLGRPGALGSTFAEGAALQGTFAEGAALEATSAAGAGGATVCSSSWGCHICSKTRCWCHPYRSVRLLLP